MRAFFGFLVMKKNGFTLTELMIVVLIVSILATFAYPSYVDHVRKTARKEAIGVALEISGRMERVRSQLFKYQAPADQNTTRYDFTTAVDDDGATFLVTATPTGDQLEDDCGTITLNNVGTWTFTKNAAVLDESVCL